VARASGIALSAHVPEQNGGGPVGADHYADAPSGATAAAVKITNMLGAGVVRVSAPALGGR
jgi:hypothetical protein